MSVPPRVKAAQSEAIDLGILDSLYRLARLLTESESAAVDLVTAAYRKAALAEHFSCADRRQLRQHLFEDLYLVFGQYSEMYPSAGKPCEVQLFNSSDPILVRQAIRRQAPAVRFMIFLHHGEGMALDEVASITGHALKVVEIRLVEFRQSLRQTLSAKAAPAHVSQFNPV